MSYTPNGYYPYPSRPSDSSAVPGTFPEDWNWPGYDPYPFPVLPGIPNPAPARMGWQCPRCGAGNAPHMNRCDCVPLITRISNTTIG